VHRRTAIPSFFLAICLLCSPATLAQQPAASSEWSGVQNVGVGEELIIKLKDGKSVNGKLTTITDTEVRIRRKNQEQTFNKDDIQQVYHSQGKAAKAKYALIGAGVGAGAGAIVGSVKNSQTIDDGGIYIVALTPIMAGAGALAGWLVGQGRRRRLLIYQAK
jgi:hypothetical protein